MQRSMTVTVNGEVCVTDVQPSWSLMELLRDHLGLIGTKNGCSQGVCGACTVLVDGRAIRACLTLALQVGGREVTTVEGLRRDGVLHPVQQAFADVGAVQCGFCTPGMLMSSVALLAETPRPGPEEVREALVGNLCRCTGYQRIVRAVVAAGQSR